MPAPWPASAHSVLHRGVLPTRRPPRSVSNDKAPAPNLPKKIDYALALRELTRSPATYQPARLPTAHKAKEDQRVIYCPYTDCDIPESRSSSEHIIALSLGGISGFEIPVDAEFNSELGSKLDGALANEFLFALSRTQYDARGHSGKEPMALIKHVSYGEARRPAQIQFHMKHGTKVRDARDGEFKGGVESFQIHTSLNIDLPIRFTAKVALAAAYFVYEDLFRENVDHRQLRDVMNLDPKDLDQSKSVAELGLEHLTLRYDSYLLEEPDDLDSEILWIRTFCASVRGSVVILMPGQGCLGVAVGVLGRYVGMVNVPADTTVFPSGIEYHWGHLIAVIDGKLKRCSWTDGLRQWAGVSVGANG